MAKVSKIVKNEQRKALVARYATRRAELVAIIKNPETDFEARFDAQQALAKLPRDSSRVRVRNRCVMTGRPRGYYRKFGLSRIALREEALKGYIPGVTKASW